MKFDIDKIDLMRVPGFSRKSKRDKKYATFNRRMMAATIDCMLLIPVMTPIINWLLPVDKSALQRYSMSGSDADASRRLLMQILTDPSFINSWVNNTMAQMAVFFAYSAICWYFWAATPGKIVMRLKIVDAKTEQPLSPSQAVLRVLGYFVSAMAFTLGFMWIGIDKRRQGWHDKFADTVVLALPWLPMLKSWSEAVRRLGSPGPSAKE